MMQINHSIKQHSELPVFAVTLSDINGTPVDLTDATSVDFSMVILGGDTVISAEAEIVEATDGTVFYEFSTEDTATAGTYVATFTASFAGDIQQAFPYNGYYIIQIEPDLSEDVSDETITLVFATVAQARGMGYELTEKQLKIAEGFIEVVCGRTTEELGAKFLGTSDLAILKKATVYQAVWMKPNPDAAERTDITKVRTAGLSGESAELTADGIILAPLARRLLTRLSWVRSRSIKTRRSIGSSVIDINRADVGPGFGWVKM